MSLLVSDIAFCKFSTKTYSESLGAEEHIISSARNIETAVSCHLLLGNGVWTQTPTRTFTSEKLISCCDTKFCSSFSSLGDNFDVKSTAEN